MSNFIAILLIKSMQLFSSLRFSINMIDSSNSNSIIAKPMRVMMLGPSLNQQGGMASVEKLIMQKIANEIKVHHISTHEEGSPLRRFWVFLLALGRLSLGLSKNEIDLIHIHVSERASVFRAATWILLAKLFRKPVVMHTHGCEFHIFHATLPKFTKQFVNWIFQQCAYVITLSQSWKSYYITHCELSTNRVIVLANPVKLPEQVPNRQGRDIVQLVCLGRIGQRKGSFDLLHAFAGLPPEQKLRARLVLAGDGDVETARSLSDRLGIAAYVEFPGWLSSGDCEKLLAKSDVFVLPSYNEGLPMALLEAMGWGMPVISTPIGGIPEVVTDQQEGLLLKAGDIEQLSATMQILIDDEDMRITIGKNARRRVIPFNLDSYSLSLSKLYQSVFLEENLSLDFPTTGNHLGKETE